MRSVVFRWRQSHTRDHLADAATSLVKWISDIRYVDPVQRAAIDHVHDDLRNMGDRIHRYTSATEPVRNQVRRELKLRIERALPGNTSPALISTLSILGTGVTLLLTFVFCLLNGWFALAAAATDPASGQTHGIDASQVAAMFGGAGQVLLIAAIGLACVAWAVVSSARDRDRLRATHQVWLDAYTNVETEKERLSLIL